MLCIGAPKGSGPTADQGSKERRISFGPFVNLPRPHCRQDRAAEPRFEGIRAEFEVPRTAPRCHPDRDRRECPPRDRRYPLARSFPAFVAGWSPLPLFNPLSVLLAPRFGQQSRLRLDQFISGATSFPTSECVPIRAGCSIHRVFHRAPYPAEIHQATSESQCCSRGEIPRHVRSPGKHAGIPLPRIAPRAAPRVRDGRNPRDASPCN